MDDDFNTAEAMGYVFNLIRLANKISSEKSFRKSESGREIMTRILNHLKEWGLVLGLFNQPSNDFLRELKSIRCVRNRIDQAQIQALIDERLTARKNKDFAQADRIRDKLSEMGIEVKDTPQGAEWDFV